MGYDYDEVLKAKERRVMWICLGVAVVMAVVAGVIIQRNRPEEKKNIEEDEAYKRGLYDRARDLQELEGREIK